MAPRSQTLAIPDAVAHFGTNARDVVVCRVCGRTLLVGERSIGFFTESGDGPFDVCQLCAPRAGRYGLRARPSTPDEVTSVRATRRGRRDQAALAASPGRFAPITRLFSRRDRPAPGATAIGAAAVPIALAAFNESSDARTLAGLYKTLGAPRASVVPRSATDREVILTVAWEIVWYQFRILPDGSIEQSRGTYLSDLPARWRQWNCTVQSNGKVAAPEPDDHPLPAHALDGPGALEVMEVPTR